jgi:hypothetical protein
MTLDDAIDAVSRLVGAQLDWTLLSVPAGERGRRIPEVGLGSSFVAALELARQGALEHRPGRGVRAVKVRAAWMDEFTRAVEATCSRPPSLTSTKSPSMSARARSKSRSATSPPIMKATASSS